MFLILNKYTLTTKYILSTNTNVLILQSINTKYLTEYCQEILGIIIVFIIITPCQLEIN